MSAGEEQGERRGPQDARNAAGAPRVPAGTRAMAVVRWLLVASMALIALASLAGYLGWFGSRSGPAAAQYHCPMHPQVVQDHPGECPICSMTLVIKAAPPSAGDAADAALASEGYYCPMHPEVTSSHAGATCPKCGGMKLVPKPKAPSAEATVPGLAPIALSAERVQLSGLATARVERAPLAPELRAAATIEFDERKRMLVAPRFSGSIETLGVVQNGQRVRKGELLATLVAPDLIAAQQEYLSALRWREGAQPLPGQAPGAGRLQQDGRQRLLRLGIAAEDVSALERTGTVLSALPLRSPLTGFVVRKQALQGAYAMAGTTLFEVADLTSVWAVAAIYEQELAAVQVGQRAALELAAYPAERFEGVVAWVSPALDPQTRALQVRVELDNAQLRLKPGMYGSVTLAQASREALVIPDTALVDTGVLQYVFVARAQGRFEPRRVRAGARAAGRVEVRAGLAEGESVVTSGNFMIDSESRLQAIGAEP